MIAVWVALLATPLVVALSLVGIARRRTSRALPDDHVFLSAPMNDFQVFGGSVPLWWSTAPTVTHAVSAFGVYPLTSGYPVGSVFISDGELINPRSLYLTEDETPKG